MQSLTYAPLQYTAKPGPHHACVPKTAHLRVFLRLPSPLPACIALPDTCLAQFTSHTELGLYENLKEHVSQGVSKGKGCGAEWVNEV